MARRPVFAADTPASALRDYILNAIAESFMVNRVLPLMRRPPAEPAPPLPMLFEDLPEQRMGEPAIVAPAPAPQPAVSLDPRDYPNAALMDRIMGDSVGPPSALAVTRRRKARERAEAAAAAAAAAQLADVSAPEYPPFTPKQEAGIDSFAWGEARNLEGADHRKVWLAFISEHAYPIEMEVPMPKGFSAKIRMTSTRLGYTAGYSYEEPRGGCGGGGYLIPQVDDEGWFFWNSQKATVQEAANELWIEFDYPPGKEQIRRHFASLGIDVEVRAGERSKRRVVSRATVAARYRRDPPEVDVPSMRAYEAYERAVGLTDVDGIPGDT